VRCRRYIAAVFVLGVLSVYAQEPPSPPKPERADSNSVKPPVPVSTPEAQFPKKARVSGKQGICLVSVVVDANGNPQNPSVVRCTDPVFAENSLAAVMKYKFTPAITVEGKAVSVKISVEVNFRFRPGNQLPSDNEMPTVIKYTFLTLPGITSTAPSPDGVYPLSEMFKPPNSPPRMLEFVSKGLGEAAVPFPDGVGCDLFLTVDAKGKPSDAKVSHCDESILEKPALESLLKSKYKAATLNGKDVSVRAALHLAYEGFGAPVKLR
jgi:TonB family protein